MRLGDVHKTLAEFQRDIVGGAVHPRTGVYMAEKVTQSVTEGFTFHISMWPGDEVAGGQLPGEGAPGGEDPGVHRQRAGGHQEAQPRRAAARGEGRGRRGPGDR